MTTYKPRPQQPSKTRSELIQALQMKQAEIRALNDEMEELLSLASSHGQQRYDDLRHAEDAAEKERQQIMSKLQVVHAYVDINSLVVVDPQLLSDSAQQEIAELVEEGVAAPIEASGNGGWWELHRAVGRWGSYEFVLRPVRPHPELHPNVGIAELSRAKPAIYENDPIWTLLIDEEMGVE